MVPAQRVNTLFTTVFFHTFLGLKPEPWQVWDEECSLPEQRWYLLSLSIKPDLNKNILYYFQEDFTIILFDITCFKVMQLLITNKYKIFAELKSN